MATQEELEVLFGQGLAEETGDLVPLPAMPLLAPPPGPDEPSVAQEVEQGRIQQRVTGEVDKVAPELDELRIGDEVDVPGGGRAVITWIDPKRKRIAVGKGRHRTYVSLTDVEEHSGRKIAETIDRERQAQAREEQMPPPPPAKMPTSVGIPEGMRLFPHQLENIDFISSRNGRGLIADEMGLGKLQPVDAQVLTPSGWRRIGDLVPGDYVIGSSGSPTRVKGVYPQGVKDSYRVRFSDGSSVEAGDEHLWTVAHRKGGRAWEELTLTTRQMRIGGVLERPHPKGGTTHLDLSKTVLYLPMLGAPAAFAGDRKLPLDGYLLGALIANGGLGHGTPNLTTNEKDWPEVKSFLEGAPMGSEHRFPGCVRVTFSGLMDTIRSLDLDTVSGTKRIPRIYFTAPVAERIALLQGLMDADGSISKKRCKVAYHTTSEGLAYDVQELVECLGGIASIREYDRSHEDKPTEYRVRIRTPLDIPPFRVRRKLSRWQPGSHAAPKRTFVSAEYVRDVESVCIEVEAEDNLYVTEHAILTHNTISALVCIEAPAVIVCPALLKVNWGREINKWLPDLSVTVLNGSGEPTDEEKRADVVVVNYDILHSHVGWLMARPNRTLIADEAHYLKNLDVRWNKRERRHEASTRSPRRATAFYHLHEEIPRLIFLTGTPLLNRVKELFPLLHMLDRQTWGSGYNFCMRYCAGHFEFLGRRQIFKCDGRSNMDELHERINGVYMIRHTKEAELKNLPAKTRGSVTVSLSKGYAQQYRKARNDFLAWLIEHEGEEAVGRALQAEALVKLNKLRGIAAAGKAEAAVQHIVDHFESTGRPLVVMGVHRDAFDLIRQGLDAVNAKVSEALGKGKEPPIARPIRHGMVVGGQSPAARQAAIDAFQLEGTLDVLLYSIPIATGTTLTRANDMVFIERMWRPADQLQAEDRIHRIGQEQKVFITYLDAEGTIDQKLAQLLMLKSETAAAVIDGVDLSMEESAALVMGEMLAGGGDLFGSLRDLVENTGAPRSEEVPLGYRGPVPRMFDADGERVDDYEPAGEDYITRNPPDIYEELLDEGEILDSWGDPQ